MSLPSLTRLTSGLALSPATVGAITSVAPPATCPICLEPLYGCDGLSSQEQAAKRARTTSGDDGDDGDDDESPQTKWPTCPHEQWYAPQPVAVLNGCGHFVHKVCMGRSIRFDWATNDGPKCPSCRTSISHEDCDELLEVVDGPNSAHIDNHPRNRNGETIYYEGSRGRRHIVRVALPNGTVKHYEGGRIVRANLPNGNVQHYDDGKLVRLDLPDGNVKYYEGGVVVRLVLSNGNVQHYEGGVVVRINLPNGNVQHYEEGRVVRVDVSNGNVQHYEEGRGVRIELPNGNVQYYEGGSLVRIYHHGDGSVDYFEGGILARVDLRDGIVGNYVPEE